MFWINFSFVIVVESFLFKIFMFSSSMLCWLIDSSSIEKLTIFFVFMIFSSKISNRWSNMKIFKILFFFISWIKLNNTVTIVVKFCLRYSFVQIWSSIIICICWLCFQTLMLKVKIFKKRFIMFVNCIEIFWSMISFFLKSLMFAWN